MKIIKISLFFVLLFSLNAYSQDYYWYNGSKIRLEIDSTKLNVTTIKDVDLSKLLQGFEAISEVNLL